MANVSRPQGAVPYGRPLRVTNYTPGGTIYPGDFVSLKNDGTVISAAATGDATCGVSASYATTADADVLVFDHPDQKFVVQSDDANPSAQTDINLNYKYTITAASTAYRVSRMELDGSTGATTVDLPLKLLGIERTPNNTLAGQPNCKCIVQINNHQLQGGTGTVGV